VEMGDMDLLAYSHVIAHLIDWQNDTKRYLALKGPKIEAVKAVADASMESNGGLLQGCQGAAFASDCSC